MFSAPGSSIARCLLPLTSLGASSDPGPGICWSFPGLRTKAGSILLSSLSAALWAIAQITARDVAFPKHKKRILLFAFTSEPTAYPFYWPLSLMLVCFSRDPGTDPSPSGLGI